MFYFLLALIIADQLTKLTAITFSTKINLTIIHNTGVAFGMLGQNVSSVIFLTASLLILLTLFKKLVFLKNSWHQYSYCFIIAGGAGNLLDRILYGYVIDFLKLPLIPYFNFADVFINIGMVLYVMGVYKNNDTSLQK